MSIKKIRLLDIQLKWISIVDFANFIDELDSSLHPLLVNELLKLFLESNKQTQLIITTHELRTLDFELVRRDEIWFTEKKENGNTKLYSLEEFKDVARFDGKIDRAYLGGYVTKIKYELGTNVGILVNNILNDKD